MEELNIFYLHEQQIANNRFAKWRRKLLRRDTVVVLSNPHESISHCLTNDLQHPVQTHRPIQKTMRMNHRSLIDNRSCPIDDLVRLSTRCKFNSGILTNSGIMESLFRLPLQSIFRQCWISMGGWRMNSDRSLSFVVISLNGIIPPVFFIILFI